MSSVELDYGAMWRSQLAAEKGARECEVYKIELQGKVTKKLDSLECGSTGHTSSAGYFARQKIAALDKKKEKLTKHGKDMSEAIKYAKETDRNVSSYIKKDSREIRTSNGMKVNIITEFMTWLSTSVLNSTTFGRWLNQTMRDIGNWVDKGRRKFKEWYYLDGGKYIFKAIANGILVIAAVVALVFVAWPALTAAAAGLLASGLSAAAVWTVVTAGAAFVTACVTIADCTTKYLGNVQAIMAFEDDPGWAQRYGSYESFADYLRKNNFNSGFLNKISNIAAEKIDQVSFVAGVINVLNVAHHGKLLYDKIKTDGIKRYFGKLHFKTKSGKVTWGSFKYGTKHLIENVKTFNKLWGDTSISRLNDFYKEGNNVKSWFKVKTVIDSTIKIADKGWGNWTWDKVKSKSAIMSTYDDIKDIFDSQKELRDNYRKPEWMYSQQGQGGR